MDQGANLDWSVIANLITAGVTALISIYNLLTVMEMRAARKVTSEALLEVLGVGQRLSVFLDPMASPAVVLDQNAAARDGNYRVGLLSLINLSRGPAFDIRLDLEFGRDLQVRDLIVRRFGTVTLTADGSSLTVECGGSCQVFPVLHRMSIRHPAVPGDTWSSVSFAVDQAFALSMVVAHLAREAAGSSRDEGRPLVLPVHLRYRDISRRHISVRKTVAFVLVSSSQEDTKLRLTFEVDDIAAA